MIAGKSDSTTLAAPTLTERVDMALRAIHGDREFTDEERKEARSRLLDGMAEDVANEIQGKLDL
ncbi:MAG TPA: hypothetical protein VG753_02955 [Candidatus Paceibacterota bacterium]|nr:hypothetical protein [Candidatus Paceibacterota bacterium]